MSLRRRILGSVQCALCNMPLHMLHFLVPRVLLTTIGSGLRL